MRAGPTSTQTPLPVAILLGGKGTRLGLDGLPKPMVPFLGRPLLEHLVEGAVAQGFTDFVFLSGHLHEVIEDHFGDGAQFGASIRYSIETQPLGTVRATYAARDMLGDEFLLLYGDVFQSVDLTRFLTCARSLGGAGTLMAHPNDHPYDSDLIVVDPLTCRITAFLGKPHTPAVQRRNLVNAGLYYMRSTIFDTLPTGDALFDWGRDVFSRTVEAGVPLHAYRTGEYMKDIGTPDRLAQAQDHVRGGKAEMRNMRRPQQAVFVDRDGVLNREIGGVHRPSDLALLPSVAETVVAINRSPYLAIGITNQPDLAKGLFGLDDLDAVHAALDEELVAAGGFLDDLFFCPHHPEAGFAGEVPALKRVCDCRKPAPGLLLEAATRYNIDLSRSYMIGDRESDLRAGRAAGVRTMLVHRDGAPDLPDESIDLSLADHVVPDLAAAWADIQAQPEFPKVSQ